MRELFYDRNPGDARVKVGSERKFASSLPAPPAPSFGLDEIGTTMIGNSPAGALQNRCCQRGVESQKEPCRYRSKAGQECKAPRRYVCKTENAIQSDAQLLLIIAHRSNACMVYFFAPGPPKPPRNRPETDRVQNRYLFTPLRWDFELKPPRYRWWCCCWW